MLHTPLPLLSPQKKDGVEVANAPENNTVPKVLPPNERPGVLLKRPPTETLLLAVPKVLPVPTTKTVQMLS